MTTAILDSQFVAAVLEIYFDFEAGKASAESTINALQSKLKEAETSEQLAHQGKVLEYLGATEYHQNRLEEARQYYEAARRVYTAGQHHRLIGMLDLNIGNIYFAKGWYERSKDYYIKAYSLAERYQYTALQAFALNNYGFLLYTLGEYQQAQKTLEKAYTMGQAPWDDISPEDSHNLVKYRQRNNVNLAENMALVAFAQERYQAAWDYAQNGLAIALEYELKVHQAYFARLLANLLSVMPELDASQSPDAYFQQAIELFVLVEHPLELAQTYITYAKSAYQRGLFSQAQDILSQAKKWTIQNNLTKEMVEINDLEVLWRPKV